MGVRVQFGSSLAFERPAVRRVRERRAVIQRTLPVLTVRQAQLAPLMADGLRNKEIALQMGICEGRVKVMSSEMFRRVGVSGRHEFVEWYRHSGLDARPEVTPVNNVVRMGAFE